MKETKQKTESDWEQIDDGTFYRFENINDSLEGVLADKGKSERYGVGMYEIETQKGHVRILGKTQLDRLMKDINIGDYINITYIDDMTTPKGDMKIFNVKRKKTS